MEHNCVSINFEVKPSTSGTHNCELNNSTHKEHEKDLKKAENYLYHGTNVRISCNINGISYHLKQQILRTQRLLQLCMDVDA